MTPTVCMSELPTSMRNTPTYSQKKQTLHNVRDGRQQRRSQRRRTLALVKSNEVPLTPPTSPIWEPRHPVGTCASPTVTSSTPSIDAKVPSDLYEQWKVLVVRRRGLIDILIRTMALVRRNNILQEKVDALRSETRDFLRSVLNNPENQSRQQQKLLLSSSSSSSSSNYKVSSSIEDTNTVPRPQLPPTPDSISYPMSSLSSITSPTCSCSSSDGEDDLSLDEDGHYSDI